MPHGAGAAAFASGDEHHVGAFDHLFDFVAMRLACGAAHFGIAACTEAAREFAPNVEFDIGIAHQQCLRICVDSNELNALEACIDHAVDGVDATSAHTDDLDHCEIILRRACHQGTSDICSND